MKKTLLLMMSCMVALFANAQELTPIITLTAEVDGTTEKEFLFGSAVEGENKVSIDWGDGNIVEVATLEKICDNYNVYPTSIKGIPTGKGEIKIYSTEALNYFSCVSNMYGPGYTTLDVSKATELFELLANGNKLTSFDGSMLTKLKTLYLNNNILTEVKLPSSLTTELNLEGNKLESLDASNLTSLIKLTVSKNATLTALDLSNCTALKYVIALDCNLTSFKIGETTAKGGNINVNNSKLETLDVSKAGNLEGGRLFAAGNNLTEIKFPNVKLAAANISNNKFTLATIPAKANVTSLTYVPQQAMEIGDIEGTIDLSEQDNLVGFGEEAKATVYTWYTEDGTELVAGTDYTEKDGVFTFIAPQEQKVYCTMSNDALPKFTGANIFKTVAVSVVAATTGIESIEAAELVGDIYTVDGKLIKRNASVAAMQKGLYIVKTAAGEAVKVICE